MTPPRAPSVPLPGRLRAAAADLLLGSRCVGCGSGGPVLCPGCRSGLPSTARLQTTPGLAPTWVAGDYDGLLRELVLAHKEHGVWGLRRILADLLAAAVRAGTRESRGRRVPLVLVPVPSRAAATRSRGYDPTRAVVASAAVLLGTEQPTLWQPLLRLRSGVRDQAGLNAAERSANLDGSMVVSAAILARLHRRHRYVRLVVCDDVVTTGATAGEAQHALARVGLANSAIAAIAGTQRRTSPHRARGSLPD